MRAELGRIREKICRRLCSTKPKLVDAFPGEHDIRKIVANDTMVHETGISFTAAQAQAIIETDCPGVYVECGVWRGGSSLAMLLAQRIKYGKVLRPVYMFDSFEGLPAPKERDGPLAGQWQKGETHDYFDNCVANEDQVRKTMDHHGFIENQDFFLRRGWFDTTVPAAVDELKERGVALLRLDGDWYDSTIVCLKHLEPLCSEHSCIIVDDYFAWDGCARAVHDYLSEQNLPYRIRSLPYNYAAYMVKSVDQQGSD